MLPLFRKPLLAYHAGLFILVAVTGIAAAQLTSEYIILGAILLIEYIILLVIMLHIYDKFMKPVEKTSRTVDELVKGNYRARIHHSAGGSLGRLNNKLNVLARNLSEFQIQEKVQRDQLKTVIDNTQSGLVLIDEKGYIHLVNREFISMFGGSAQDYQSFLYYDVLAEETIQETVQQTFLYETNIKHSFTQTVDVDTRYIEIVGAPIFSERWMLKGAVLLLYDITHLKKLELMRKDFVANVSHELKTPMTSITGFAETLLNGAKDDTESLDRFLMIIYDESYRLQGLIEDLLTLSRLESDELEINRTDIDMHQLTAEVLPVIDQRAKGCGITLLTDVKDDVPLKADGERVKQIILNLLINAISYTGENGTVNLAIEGEGEMIHIQVRDNGIGIPQQAIPRIFERFYRVDKARSRNTGGTGLGLAIVKHIVEVHEGDISVESEPDKGSVFHVYLPKYDAASTQ